MTTIPAPAQAPAAYDPNDLDTLINQAISLKRTIKSFQEQLTGILDLLALAVAAGDLDPSFTHNVTSFRLSGGKTTYTYPAEVKAAADHLKQLQADAVAAGKATANVGAPYWTVKLPD